MSSTRTRVLGTCRLVEPLGKGGMAEVYRGLQTSLQREVAVKVILPELCSNAEAVTRFRREALALAGLAHENIVAVHDLMEKNGQLFLVMELVDGVDIKTLLQEGGPLPLDVSLLVAWKIAAALEHAHFRKVLHRDVKPGNVMVSQQGQVKLADFGIAKDMTIDDLTRTGQMVGTPSYMAPEIICGRKPDPRTDLYAVGVMLFEILTGKKPFTAANHGQLFANITSGKRTRLRELNSDVPRAVEKIVDRCLAVDPAKRWARSAELRAALEQEASRHVLGNPSARLVLFLKERGRVRDDEISWLDLQDRWFQGEEEEGPSRLDKSLALSIAIDLGESSGELEGETKASLPTPLPDRSGASPAKSRSGGGRLGLLGLRLSTALGNLAILVIVLAMFIVALIAVGLALVPDETHAFLSGVSSRLGGVLPIP